MNLLPPWVLFCNSDPDCKPVAILPAGRPGEVANISHLTMSEAEYIVNKVNSLVDCPTRSKLESEYIEILLVVLAIGKRSK
jgi:hypothetical protein